MKLLKTTRRKMEATCKLPYWIAKLILWATKSQLDHQPRRDFFKKPIAFGFQLTKSSIVKATKNVPV